MRSKPKIADSVPASDKPFALSQLKGCSQKAPSLRPFDNVLARKMVRVAFSLFKNHKRFDLALVCVNAVNA